MEKDNLVRTSDWPTKKPKKMDKLHHANQ